MAIEGRWSEDEDVNFAIRANDYTWSGARRFKGEHRTCRFEKNGTIQTKHRWSNGEHQMTVITNCKQPKFTIGCISEPRRSTLDCRTDVQTLINTYSFSDPLNVQQEWGKSHASTCNFASWHHFDINFRIFRVENVKVWSGHIFWLYISRFLSLNMIT